MEREDCKIVEITVALWVREDADVGEVVSEMNYMFEHADIADSEIRDINTEL